MVNFKIQVWTYYFYYLSRKFINIYQEREKLTFSFIALICDSRSLGRERKIYLINNFKIKTIRILLVY